MEKQLDINSDYIFIHSFIILLNFLLRGIYCTMAIIAYGVVKLRGEESEGNK